METLLYLVLGWLFGLLSPGIADRIRRSYRIAEVTQAIIAELNELRYTVALAAFIYGRRTESLNDKALDWMVPAIRAYNGPLVDPKAIESAERLRAIPEADRRRYLGPIDPAAGLSLKVLSTPLLNAHLSDMALFPIAFQSTVLRVKSQVDIYNQHVGFLQEQFNLTFSVSDPQNHRTLLSNQQNGFRELARMAETISGLIGIIQSRALGHQKGDQKAPDTPN